MKPIMNFKDEKEAQKCLKEWQHRLFLDDWTIKIVLCNSNELKMGKNTAGENEYERINKSAIVRINNFKDDNKNEFIAKICDECTLIHELLHCKYNWLNYKDDIENLYYDDQEHQLLEQMAKSLLMAKYNLDFEWFKNF